MFRDSSSYTYLSPFFQGWVPSWMAIWLEKVHTRLYKMPEAAALQRMAHNGVFEGRTGTTSGGSQTSGK